MGSMKLSNPANAFQNNYFENPVASISIQQIQTVNRRPVVIFANIESKAFICFLCRDGEVFVKSTHQLKIIILFLFNITILWHYR